MSVSRKILLVDDDNDLREALAEQLMMMDEFDVYEADSGGNGLERARNAGRRRLVGSRSRAVGPLSPRQPSPSA